MAADALSVSASTVNCQNWFVVDFDGTCSINDTTPMLPRLAALCAKELAGEPSPSMTLEERQSKFSELEQEYFALYLKAKSECQPPPATDKNESNNKETVISSLAQALDRLDQVSNIVTAKVSTSGCLKELQADLEHTDFVLGVVRKYDEVKVGIRPHCGSILRQILHHHHRQEEEGNNKWGLAVLSVNWCPSLIAASLRPEIEQYSMPIIWSNRVDSKTGRVELSIPGALAKQEKIASLRSESLSSSSSSPRGLIVYVGDSSTDLLAILEADVGILFGGSSSAIALAQQYGVTVKPLSERNGWMGNDITKTASEPIIWTAGCWSEVEALMKGDDASTWFR
ncbi:unnamed protein product [Cylindrotheca closterium]|uniref:Uncharacterized protein n=1 Tax=Cylindrotheca closterium TaxID=2856 RepID=A0AAD2CM65_9STRA|nr:unnamed protein product [Cylindrotheca closterium]